MDIDQMTVAQLHALAQQIQDMLVLRTQQQEQERDDMKLEVFQAIDTLTGLLGDVDSVPPAMEDLLIGNVSIREVLTFDTEDLQAYSGLAIQLLLRGLELVVSTQIALAVFESRRP